MYDHLDHKGWPLILGIRYAKENENEKRLPLKLGFPERDLIVLARDGTLEML